MREVCRLREAGGVLEHCDGDECVYWRIVDHLGLVETADGCAVQHFGMIDGGEDVARWLLSVKDRVERPRSDA